MVAKTAFFGLNPKKGGNIFLYRYRNFPVFLLYELLNGPVQFVDGGPVLILHRLHDTVLQMILENDLTGVVQSASHGGQLDEHLRAVPSLLHHSLHPLQMADSPGQPVHHRAGMLVAVDMAVIVSVGVAMAVDMTMIVVMGDAVGMHIVVVMQLRLIHRTVLFHSIRLLANVFCIVTEFSKKHNPRRGILANAKILKRKLKK